MIKLKSLVLLLLITLVSLNANAQQQANISGCYLKECHDNLYFNVSANSGKRYTRIKVREYPNGSFRQNTSSANGTATIDWIRRGKRYEIAVYSRSRTWLPWAYRCSYIEYVKEGVQGDLTLNKSIYCKDDPIIITPNLSNNSSIGYLTVIKDGNGVFNTDQFNYNNPLDLQQILNTPNKYGNTYSLTPGNYSINFRVNEPNSACSKNYILNFEIQDITFKEPEVTYNFKDTYSENTYTIHNVCNTRNNDGLWLRINRDIPLSTCEKIDEKFSVTISEFNTSTGNSNNTQNANFNIPSTSTRVIKLKYIFPTYSFSYNTIYKINISGQISYFKLLNRNDCYSISNPDLSPNHSGYQIRI